MIEIKENMDWKFKTKGCGLVIYEKGTEDTHYKMFFDMESRTVYATCERFIYKNANVLIPQSDEHIRHSCKYGHWETEQMHLSFEDIEFMRDTALKLGLWNFKGEEYGNLFNWNYN